MIYRQEGANMKRISVRASLDESMYDEENILLWVGRNRKETRLLSKTNLDS